MKGSKETEGTGRMENRWVRRQKLILAGVFAFPLGLLLFFSIQVNLPGYLSSDSEMCATCHVMEPYYSTWIHSSHRITTQCVDCHLPHDNLLHKYYTKFRDGSKDMILYATELERNVPKASRDTIVNIQGNCRRCHGQLISEIYTGWKIGQGDRVCWDCHRTVPHGKARGLATVSEPSFPGKIIPVQEWLKSMVIKNKGDSNANEESE